MNDLEKVDLIRARTGVSYKEAAAALAAAGGDVVQALIQMEEKGRMVSRKVRTQGREAMGRLRGILEKGKETRIKLKKGDKTVIEFPASVGALGVLGILASSELAILGTLGAVTGMANRYSLEIDRPDHMPGFGPGPGPGQS